MIFFYFYYFRWIGHYLFCFFFSLSMFHHFLIIILLNYSSDYFIFLLLIKSFNCFVSINWSLFILMIWLCFFFSKLFHHFIDFRGWRSFHSECGPRANKLTCTAQLAWPAGRTLSTPALIDHFFNHFFFFG